MFFRRGTRKRSDLSFPKNPMLKPVFLPLTTYQEYPADQMKVRIKTFCSEMLRRRTVRQFSTRPVPQEIIDECLLIAGSAPSGANLQPWHFVVVRDSELKRRIREAAEREEAEFYQKRAPAEWLEALAPLGTDEYKPYLETAPYLIAVFGQTYQLATDGRKTKNYYVTESVGIATGMLITAIHMAGLVSLTHTPSPMGFLNNILNRPPNERAFLILVVGYPAQTAEVPKISKKSLGQIATYL
jgi:iodotyrosine deiodinase